MNDALALLQHERRKSGTSIVLKKPVHDCLIHGFSVELTQAIYNLMHNACLSAPHEGFEIEICSNRGFAEIHIRNIVEPEAPKNHGFGVGFHIARSIIEAHEGSITPDNRNDHFHTLVKIPETLVDDTQHSAF